MHTPDDAVADADAHGLPQSMAEQWLAIAKADYRLCRVFAQQFDAHLPRTLRGGRVGWESYGHLHFALLLPDPAGFDSLPHSDWYLYYTTGESVFRRTAAQRAQMNISVLAECVEDWAVLLRQALRNTVFDVRYEVVPSDLDACGETGHTPSGFVFALEAYAPQATGVVPLRIAGAGATPEQAAREACRRWLQMQGFSTEPGAAGRSCVTR